ncbi:hypothetical protein TH19_02575 [Thalassospira profundimaris]|uniref:Uncharacterized protein n=1 Tax=Thalassospira profundimaris TaxID=502049 RepID=A0A367WFB3_9PROT|nr:hypothetical protein TH19_02575 [Thalassospira profundimaris]
MSVDSSHLSGNAAIVAVESALWHLLGGGTAKGRIFAFKWRKITWNKLLSTAFETEDFDA